MKFHFEVSFQFVEVFFLINNVIYTIISIEMKNTKFTKNRKNVENNKTMKKITKILVSAKITHRLAFLLEMI